MTLRAREVTFAVGAVLAAGLFVRLGVWQIDRLHQRRRYNAGVSQRRALPPLELPAPAVPVESLLQRRVVVRGAFDYDHERPWRGRTFQDAPGVDLVTPLRLADGSAVFVDRGWVPSPDAFHVDQRAWREPDSATVEGLAVPAPRGRGDVDPARLRDSLPFRILPIVIIEGPAAGHPAAAVPHPRRWVIPSLDDGPHLSYAIQWFSFALITLIGTGFLLRTTIRGSK